MVSNFKKTVVIYRGLLTLENVDAAVNYHGVFITLAPGGRNWQLLCPNRVLFLDG
jgi:hypothetical protein